MKKFKLLLILFVCSIFYFLVTTPILAADAVVTCNPINKCQLKPQGPLFNFDNIYPGWTVTKTLEAVNNYPEDRNFALEIVNLATNELSQLLSLTITDGYQNVFGPETLKICQESGFLKLSNIPANSTKNYELTITMDNVGNNWYQKKDTSFGIKLGFDALPATTGQIAGIKTEQSDKNLSFGFSDVITKWWWLLIILGLILLLLWAFKAFGNGDKSIFIHRPQRFKT